MNGEKVDNIGFVEIEFFFLVEVNEFGICMLTKASSETDEGDVEDHKGHQALVPQQPHGPPDARHWHQGARLHHLSQLTLLLHQLFLHQSFHTILMQ